MKRFRYVINRIAGPPKTGLRTLSPTDPDRMKPYVSGISNVAKYRLRKQ